MKTKLKPSRRLNFLITKSVIKLQDRGYHFDYLMLNKNELFCIQSNQLIPADSAMIKLIELGYDHLQHCFKYVHTVEAYNGENGLLVTEGIFCNQC